MFEDWLADRLEEVAPSTVPRDIRLLKPIFKQAAEFAIETGCRRSELLRLDRKHFDARKGSIWLPDAKNNRGRDLLLNRKAQDLVEALPGRTRAGKIFPITANLLKKAYERGRGGGQFGDDRLQLGRIARQRRDLVTLLAEQLCQWPGPCPGRRPADLVDAIKCASIFGE